jgi:hypothetical protein
LNHSCSRLLPGQLGISRRLFAIAFSHAAAAVYAAQIRFDRRLTPANTARIDPADLPSDPAVIEALLYGTSPTMGVLDEIGGDVTEVV